MRKRRRAGSGLRAQGSDRSTRGSARALSLQPLALLARAAALAAFVFGLAAPIGAHDIPNDVTIQTLVRPEGGRLKVLVRVPLQAMRDMDYPKPRDTTNTDLLDLARADATLRDAATLWISDYLDFYENGAPLPAPQVVSVRAALQSDKSFASYDEAIAHFTAPGLPVQTEFFWSQGLLDVLFEYPIQSDRSRFSIQPRLARLGLRTLTVLRFLPPGGGVRSFEFQGDPGLVRLDPRWFDAARLFVGLGFGRLVGGADQLLFLLVLAIPLGRRLRSLVAVAAAFAVAHSITLLATTAGLAPDALWFPPLVDVLSAASVVYLALENIVLAARMEPRSAGLRGWSDPTASARQAPGPSKLAAAVASEGGLKRRWIATFGFGLVHGFVLALALRPALQLAGSHPVTATLSFNAGVELGMLLVLALLVPALALLFHAVIGWRTGTIVASALAGHTAWHWMGERWDLLRRFTFERPVVDAAFLAGALRWMMLLVVAAALYWLVFGVLDSSRDDGAAGNLKSEI